MNPCPCGYHGAPNGNCRCTPDQIHRYHGKISGPLLDRIDMQIEVAANTEDLLYRSKPAPAATRDTLKERISDCRQLQHQRQKKTNADLVAADTDQFCALTADCLDLMSQAIQRLRLSGRAYHRLLKVARTIADLEQSDAILPAHLMEAMSYRKSI